MDKFEEYWPEDLEDLTQYITDMIEASNVSYASVVYGIAKVALAAKNYAATQMGASGYQASASDLVTFAKSRNLEAPFGIVNANDMLYPQYNILETVQGWIDGWREWAAEAALEKIKDRELTPADEVLQHWINLASFPRACNSAVE